MSFNKLKTNSNFDKLTKAIEELNKNPNTSSKEDNSLFWNPRLGKDGNGTFVIRFLPVCEVDESENSLPWVQLFSHAFSENGKWYIENCNTTIGQPCPVCDSNKELWSRSEEHTSELQSH